MIDLNRYRFRDIMIAVTSSPQGENVLNPNFMEDNPIGGSESSAMWVNRAFNEIGFNSKIVINNSDIHSTDIFIALRNFRVFDEVEIDAKVKVLWCQDDVQQLIIHEKLRDKEYAENLYSKIDYLIMISHYQANQWVKYLNAPVEKIIISQNGIPLDKFNVTIDDLKNKTNDIYFSSTPYRGLNQLLHVWEIIHKYVPDTTLHIFSSLKVYNIEEKNEYIELYEKAKSLPQIVYHGSVGQKKLREYAAKSKILAYPSVYAETGCIAAIEAMASGCAVVTTSLGALPETAWHNPSVVMEGDWLYHWGTILVETLLNDEYYYNIAKRNLELAKFYDWKYILFDWIEKFNIII